MNRLPEFVEWRASRMAAFSNGGLSNGAVDSSALQFEHDHRAIVLLLLDTQRQRTHVRGIPRADLARLIGTLEAYGLEAAGRYRDRFLAGNDKVLLLDAVAHCDRQR